MSEVKFYARNGRRTIDGKCICVIGGEDRILIREWRRSGTAGLQIFRTISAGLAM